MQTHSSVSVNMTGLVKNVLCFLFSYYETSFVIFLNLMICGRLQGVSCKQTVSFTLSSCHSSLCVCVTTINVSIPESIIHLTESASVVILLYDPP